MALEEGAEVAAKEGPIKLVKMGPTNPHNLGDLEALITLRTGAVGHTGNGARVPTIAAIGLYAPGRTESFPDLYNHNSNSNHSNRISQPDSWVGSTKTGKKW